MGILSLVPLVVVGWCSSRQDSAPLGRTQFLSIRCFNYARDSLSSISRKWKRKENMEEVEATLLEDPEGAEMPLESTWSYDHTQTQGRLGNAVPSCA